MRERGTDGNLRVGASQLLYPDGDGPDVGIDEHDQIESGQRCGHLR
jgi:hypothetical protein